MDIRSGVLDPPQDQKMDRFDQNMGRLNQNVGRLDQNIKVGLEEYIVQLDQNI